MSAQDVVDKKKLPCWTALRTGGVCAKQSTRKCGWEHPHMYSDISGWLAKYKEVMETEEFKEWCEAERAK